MLLNTSLLRVFSHLLFRLPYSRTYNASLYYLKQCSTCFLNFIDKSSVTRDKTYVCVSVGKKCSFLGTFDVLFFLETPVLRFALLPYYRHNKFHWTINFTELTQALNPLSANPTKWLNTLKNSSAATGELFEFVSPFSVIFQWTSFRSNY